MYNYPERPDNVPLDNSDLLEIYLKEINEKKRPEDAMISLMELYPNFKELLNKDDYKRLRN